MGITHAETLSGYSDDGTSGVSKDEWNAAHVFSGVVAADDIWDAKGDLAAATGANAAAKLAAGTDGYVLQADSAQTTGLSWRPYKGTGTLLSGAIAETFSRYIINNATVAMNSGVLRLSAIFIPVGTVTSLSFCSGTTALSASGSPHLWAALYDSSLNLLRQSTDDTSPTWAASTLKTFTLSTPYSITTSGIYYIGFACVSGGTQPSAQGTSSVLTVGATAAAPTIGGTSSTGLSGTAPNPAASLSLTQSMLWGSVA